MSAHLQLQCQPTDTAHHAWLLLLVYGRAQTELTRTFIIHTTPLFHLSITITVLGCLRFSLSHLYTLPHSHGGWAPVQENQASNGPTTSSAKQHRSAHFSTTKPGDWKRTLTAIAACLTESLAERPGANAPMTPQPSCVANQLAPYVRGTSQASWHLLCLLSSTP